MDDGSPDSSPAGDWGSCRTRTRPSHRSVRPTSRSEPMRNPALRTRLLPGGARFACSSALVVAVSTAAFGADYVITRPTGLYQSPPSGATELNLTTSAAQRSISLPFSFQYFGKLYDTLNVSIE